MKALVVGCGKVGSEIARDLARSNEVSSVVAADTSAANLAALGGIEKISTVRVDIARRRKLLALIRDADVVCGALPGRVGFRLIVDAVAAGKNVVDISYTPEDPLRLHRKARERGCIVIPQCGVAPGLSNMCVGNASANLSRIESVRIYVGGLPQDPVPPLNYKVVFSLDDVINEYTRMVTLIRNGRRELVEPLSGRGHLEFPSVGKLEYFLTDGLGTLPTSFPHVREMCELTLRYPGHAEIMDAFRRIGFFDSTRVTVRGSRVEPRELSLRLLKTALGGGPPEDLLAFRVRVEGRSGKERILATYQMTDLYDRRRGITAMARTTAYPCTSVALLVGKGLVNETGVVPPERIGQDPSMFRYVLGRLRERGVRLRASVRRLVRPELARE